MKRKRKRKQPSTGTSLGVGPGVRKRNHSLFILLHLFMVSMGHVIQEVLSFSYGLFIFLHSRVKEGGGSTSGLFYFVSLYFNCIGLFFT
ncbi:hypothetical protein BDF14DRAFT_1784222 [Spinellus fusiger]|nr:hypothetical protein BDF14DRAFT_1784222 [Spinellus fusiger]